MKKNPGRKERRSSEHHRISVLGVGQERGKSKGYKIPCDLNCNKRRRMRSKLGMGNKQQQAKA